MIDPRAPYLDVLRARAEVLATRAIHAGAPRVDEGGALEAPIVLSSAFAFASAEQARGAFLGEDDAYIYGRWANPTVEALEDALAALEGAESACATASGMAAISGAILATCGAGDHVIAPQSMYAESARLLRERLPKLAVETTFVAPTPEAYADAIRPSTKLLLVETPSNPTLAVTDVARIASLGRERGLLVVADATFATPFCLSPLELGVDLAVHSTTKAISGHGDVIGGAVVGPRARVDVVREWIVKGMGSVPSPLAAHLTLRGLRTFPLRQERACASAHALAAMLAAHPSVARVHHPSLPTHPGHALAQRQMHAYGAIVSFDLAEGDTLDRGRRVLESLRVATHAVSLGDVRTLVTHPASTTHSTMPEDARARAGIGDGLLRVSVGLEAQQDLLDDFAHALSC